MTAFPPRLIKCSNGPGGGQLSACSSARRVLDAPFRQTGQERLAMNTECMMPHGANQTGYRIIFGVVLLDFCI